MRTVKEIIVVEGKYDKIKLSGIVDAVVMTTDGFGVYKNREKLELLRRLAAERGIIIFTDSDSAGFRIRAYLRKCLGGVDIKNAYIPELYGKERRKAKSGSEGLLGVEGVPAEEILRALDRAGASTLERTHPVTKADFFQWGLTGGADSAEKRRKLARLLGLPARMSANALLEVINTLYTREQFFEFLEEKSDD